MATESRNGAGSPRTEVKAGSKSLCGCCEPNLGPL